MDEQTSDFFAGMDEAPPVPTQAPPADFDDNDFMMDFAAAPTPGNPPPPPPENYIGVVEDSPEDNAYVLTEGGMPPSDEPIILGEPSSYEPMGEALPPSSDAPIILGGFGDAPQPAVIEATPEELQEPVSNEPSPLQKWNEEWQIILKERKETENSMKAEQVNAARAETDKFMEERAAKLASRKTANRSAEEEKLKTMQDDLEKDNCWERVVKLVELTQDSVEKSAEVKRMRDMIILLKNDKDRAALLS